MRIRNYIFGIAALLASACSTDNSSYKIVGTTEGIADSSIVYLRAFGGPEVIDSAVVLNGKFEIEHVYDSISANSSLVLMYIKSEEDRLWTYANLYAEPGAAIKAHLDLNNEKNNSISGSPLNEKMNAHNQEVIIYESQMDSIRTVLDMTPSMSDEQKAQASQLYDSLFNIRVSLKKAFALANTDNLIAVSMLESCTALFDADTKKQILGKVPAKYQNHPVVVNERNRLEIEERTAEGKPFTDLQMESPEGKMLKLSELIPQSKLTLIDFWASWCGPCRQEIPNIKKIYAQYKGKGLGLVGVSLDQKKENWVKAIKDMNLDYPQMSDLKGWGCAAVPAYNIQSIPFTLLVAQDGTIVGRNLHGEELEKKIEALLK